MGLGKQIRFWVSKMFGGTNVYGNKYPTHDTVKNRKQRVKPPASNFIGNPGDFIMHGKSGLTPKQIKELKKLGKEAAGSMNAKDPKSN